jgi:hypothetical protein
MLRKILLTVVLVIGTVAAGLGVLAAVLGAYSVPSPLHGAQISAGQWDRGYVIATGTWTMLNDRIGDPIQSSEIHCVKATSLCHEAVARLVNGQYLAVELYNRNIESWTDRAITFEDNSPTCVRYRYTIDRILNQVAARRVRVEPTPPACDKVAANLQMSLVDGFAIWRQENDRNRPTILIFFAALGLLIIATYIGYRIWV